MVDTISIEKIGEDERGCTHTFNTDRTGQFMIAYRKAGSLSGRHYHKGLSPNKNPEKIIIMQGAATINWFDINGPKKGSVEVKAPAMVTIQPWAWHEVVADTDIVVLELNGPADGPGDTFRLEESK
jgi:dTDP-4-dehydrorhamnose 3,5-epimerase-like enzyme